MTSTHGYFLHVPSGEVISIHEHASAVVESPELYGLTRADIASLSPRIDRREILEAVLLNSWVRIRHRKAEVSVEFLTEWLETLEAFARAIEEMGIGELCWLRFNQLATGESMEIAAHGLKEHYKDGLTFGLLRQVQMRMEE